MRITRFEEIEAWQVARQLAADVYRVTAEPRFNADQALQRQMRSCAMSVMANIAEGFDAGSHAEFARFLKISRRSATELQSHSYLALDRGHLPEEKFQALYSKANEVKNLIGGFLRYLRNPKPRTANLEPRT